MKDCDRHLEDPFAKEDVFDNMNLQVGQRDVCLKKQNSTVSPEEKQISSVLQARNLRRLQQKALKEKLSKERESIRLKNLSDWGEMQKEVDRLSKTSTDNPTLGTKKRDIIKAKSSLQTKFVQRENQIPEVSDTRKLIDSSLSVVRLDRDIKPYSSFIVHEHPMKVNTDTSYEVFLYNNSNCKKSTINVELAKPEFSKTLAKKNKKFLSKANFPPLLPDSNIMTVNSNMEQNQGGNKISNLLLLKEENIIEKSISPIDTISIDTSAKQIVNQIENASSLTAQAEQEIIMNPVQELKVVDALLVGGEQITLKDNEVEPSFKVENSFFTNNVEEWSSEPGTFTIKEQYKKEDFLKKESSNEDVKIKRKERKLAKKENKKIETLEETVKQDYSGIQEILALQAKQLEKVLSELSAMREDNRILRQQLAESESKVKQLQLEKSNLVVEEPRVEVKEVIPETKQEIVEIKNQNKVEKPVEVTKTLGAKPKVKKPTLVRSKTMPVVRFADDGNNMKVNMKKAKTNEEKKEVLANTLSQPKEVLSKATNEEVRVVNTKLVDSESFADSLKQNLLKSRSKSYHSFSKTEKIVPDKNKPKGLRSDIWEKIKSDIPEDVEDFQKKRNFKVRENYKKLYYGTHAILCRRWLEEFKNPKIENPWLCSAITAWRACLKTATEDNISAIYDAFQVWRDRTVTYVPPKGEAHKDWSKPKDLK